VSASRDTCPRCGRDFHCGVEDEAPCACTTIALHAAMLGDLRARYGTEHCLCLGCLAELAAQQEKSRPV